ncbi:MAG: hypothetical protein ISP90_12745 [Nevskia sp.]|nr:hypothetical protein [Nevskia sp.]
MKKKPIIKPSKISEDEAPKLDEGFFLRSLRRHQLEPVSAGPDAPEELKRTLRKKQQSLVLKNPRTKRRA